MELISLSLSLGLALAPCWHLFVIKIMRNLIFPLDKGQHK